MKSECYQIYSLSLLKHTISSDCLNVDMFQGLVVYVEWLAIWRYGIKTEAPL